MALYYSWSVENDKGSRSHRISISLSFSSGFHTSVGLIKMFESRSSEGFQLIILFNNYVIYICIRCIRLTTSTNKMYVGIRYPLAVAGIYPFKGRNHSRQFFRFKSVAYKHFLITIIHILSGAERSENTVKCIYYLFLFYGRLFRRKIPPIVNTCLHISGCKWRTDDILRGWMIDFI